jgi:tetratricopeptide (TPR) repeat protein
MIEFEEEKRRDEEMFLYQARELEDQIQKLELEREGGGRRREQKGESGNTMLEIFSVDRKGENRQSLDVVAAMPSKIDKKLVERLKELKLQELQKVETLREQAQLFFEVGEYEKAIESAKEALLRNPSDLDYVESYYILSKAYYALGKYDEVEKNALYGLEVNFRHVGLLSILADAYVKLEQIDSAHASVLQALDYTPENSVEVVKLRAILHLLAMRSKNIDQARNESSEAQRLFKDYLEFRNKKLSHREIFEVEDSEEIGENLGLNALMIVDAIGLNTYYPTLIGKLAKILVDHVVEVAIDQMIKRNKREKIRDVLVSTISNLTDLSGSNLILPEEWLRQLGIEVQRVYSKLDRIIRDKCFAAEVGGSASGV